MKLFGLNALMSLFLVAVGGLALPEHRSSSLTAILICVACYALASKVRFEFGGVFAVPTQPVFVAMWFLVPPRMLPLLVCGGMILAELPDFVRRRTPLDHLRATPKCHRAALGVGGVGAQRGRGRFDA